MDSRAMKREAIYKAWGDLVVRAWRDEKFKIDLMADPKMHLAALGVHFPDDVTLTVVAETPNSFALHLPDPPKGPMLPSPQISSVGNMPLMSSFGVCDGMVDIIK